MRRTEGSRAVLSKRLRMLADMVTPGNRLADVGCDHGFLDICLVQEGVCPGALAMDVREGPLGSVREHVRQYGLGDYIEIRLSDGLRACGAGEADTLVCAGMGGRLMERILTEGLDKAAQMKELILQPQSEIPEFRRFLRNAGFEIVREDAVSEDGKYYFAMKAVPRGLRGIFREPLPEEIGAEETGAEETGAEETGAEETEAGERSRQLYDMFGELLLGERHPVLRSYLLERRDCLQKLGAAMAQAGTERARGRLGEIQEELAQIERALHFFGREGSV